MNHRRFRELFEEFSAKLEEQHVYYLDSIVGFSVLHDQVISHQLDMKKILGEHDLASDEFLDTCSTMYSQLSRHDFVPMSLSPVMKQGEVKKRNTENGTNAMILAANCIVALYSYWEDYLRIEIGVAKGVLDEGATNNDETRDKLNRYVTNDLWGDLRHLRNSIVHNKGIAYSKIENCKLVKCFRPGDRVELDFDKMRAIFVLLACFRNELQSKSFPPHQPIRLPKLS